MSEKKPFDLFSSSSRPSKDHKAFSKPSKPAAPPPSAPPVPKTQPSPKSSISDLEIYEMIEKIKNMHDDLEQKLDKAYQITGLEPRFIKNYLNNPNNFKNDEWERVQKERQALLTSILGDIKQGTQSSSFKISRSGQKEDHSLNDKDRRSKTIAARRHWIPMR